MKAIHAIYERGCLVCWKRWTGRRRRKLFSSFDPRCRGADTRHRRAPPARGRDRLHAQVRANIEGGARLLLGREVPPGPRAYCAATVFTDVGPSMAAYDEELFGPVASIIPVADEPEAIRVANDTAFGLGAAVFTRDIARGERIAAESLEAGAAFVNASVRSMPALPFGGVKNSGYGRELSRQGILKSVNIKSVLVRDRSPG